jgi:hypothetical protein
MISTDDTRRTAPQDASRPLSLVRSPRISTPTPAAASSCWAKAPALIQSPAVVHGEKPVGLEL